MGEWGGVYHFRKVPDSLLYSVTLAMIPILHIGAHIMNNDATLFELVDLWCSLSWFGQLRLMIAVFFATKRSLGDYPRFAYMIWLHLIRI